MIRDLIIFQFQNGFLDTIVHEPKKKTKQQQNPNTLASKVLLVHSSFITVYFFNIKIFQFTLVVVEKTNMLSL